MEASEKYGILVDVRQRFETSASNRENALLFSYDDWVEDPDYARCLFEFLGEPYDGELVRGVLAKKHSL